MAAISNPRFEYWLAISLLGLLLPGCGGGDEGPVTAGDGQYEVALDDDDPREPTGTPADSAPAGGPGSRSADPDPGGTAKAASGSQPSPGVPSDPAAVSASEIPSPPEMPPITPDAKLAETPTEPPETESELLDYLQQLQSKAPRPATPDVMVAEMRQIQADRIAAAEKLRAVATDQRSRVAAVQTKLDAMRRLSAMGSTEIEKQLNAYSRELQNGDDPELALLGRIARFGLALDDYAAGNQDNAAAILAEVKSLVQAEGINPGVFMVTSGAAQLLHQTGRQQEAIEAYRSVGQAFQDSEDTELAAQAEWLLDRAEELELEQQFGLGGKVKQLIAGDENVIPDLVQTAGKLLNEEQPGSVPLNLALQVAQLLEMSDHAKSADEIYDLVRQRYENHEDAELAKAAMQRVENRRKRADLVGQPLAITRMEQDGAPFDWQAYRGKVVLVVFWVSWSEPCLRELGNLVGIYRGYRDKGLEIVGISLDDDPAAMQQFLDVQPLPWPTLFSAVPNPGGLQTPLAVECGVDALPFLVLVGRDGKVLAVQVTGQDLEEKLNQLLGPPATPAGDAPGGSPASSPPARSAPAKTPASGSAGSAAPADEQPAPAAPPAEGTLPETIPPPGNGSSQAPAEPAETFFVAWMQAPEPQEEAAEIDQDVNPYAPRPGLSTDELVDFIFSMQEKPDSIQQRPGFAEGIAAAADRILEAEPKDKFCEIAAEAKFTALHAAACRGDQQADQQLAAFADQMRDHRLPKIAEAAEFYRQESNALQADDLPLDKIPLLLDQLAEYLAGRSLDESCLRLASSTVRAVNRLEDEDQRERYFQMFGEIFARSSSKELARYGKKISKPLDEEPPELVGKPLELAGVTAWGTKLDWKAYRGKVVLVDFWATWCGPCRKAMPELKAFYDQRHEQGFDVVGISLDRSTQALAKYLDENKIVWENVIGEDASGLAKRYGIRGIPMMMVVDREGKVAAAGHQLEPLKAKITELMEPKSEKSPQD